MFVKNIFICLLFIIICVSHEGVSQRSKDDPCNPYNPPVPDFSKRGRRLSVEKCYEYIWRVKLRVDKGDRERQCEVSKCPGPCGGGAIGGRKTLDGEFPHMAAIGWKARVDQIGWQFKCCGSLISENFVLTAGHCTWIALDPTITESVPEIVRVGNKNIDNNNTHKDIEIIEIIPHKNYKSPKKYYDIALLKLADSIEFTYFIQPACLLIADAAKRFGPSVTATGWGVTKLGGETSKELQAVNLEIIDTDYCDELLGKPCNRLLCGLKDHQICAGNLSGGVDTCSGDSGGPLQVRLRLPLEYYYRSRMHGIIGVTSFGIKCARKNSPGVYTRVSEFLDWIEDIIWRSQD